MLRIISILAITVFCRSIAPGQVAIHGRVLDKQTQEPIENVHISIPGNNSGTITDTNGKFIIEVRKVPVVLYFSHVGYIIENLLVKNNPYDRLTILLSEENIEIQQVTVVGERIRKISGGDALNVVDYKVYNDRLIVIGNPYKNLKGQRVYLMNLNGDTISSRKVSRSGRRIKFPEIMSPKLVYLIKDCFGEVQFLTRERVWQVYINGDSIFFLYPTKYKNFFKYLFPMSGYLDSTFLYQISDENYNHTYLIRKGCTDPIEVRTVFDPHGSFRYINPGKGFSKYVSAPAFAYNKGFLIFDFFGNEICFFTRDGKITHTIPIAFHQKEFVVAIFLRFFDLDQKNFTQKIFHDTAMGKFYAYYSLRKNGRQSLREIDLSTGKIIKVIEIPDYPNISNISVYNNTLYFLYNSKTPPYYQSLYRMRI